MDKIKILALKFLLRFAGLLPLRVSQALGDLLGRLGWWFPTKTRKVTELNLDICYPDLDTSGRQELARRSLRQTTQTLMEVPLMWEWPVNRCLSLIREVEGEGLLGDALARGKGLILLAPHLGNWELAGLFFSARYRMASLYSPPKIAEFEDYMTQVRSRHGATLVRGDRRGLVELITRLRAGEVVGILPDQCPRRTGGVNAPFFGRSTRTMTLASKLRQKSGAETLMTYAQRLPGHRGFRIVIRRCEGDIGVADPIAGATALNRSVEACVRACPEQYQWEYKRFKYGPPDLKNPYRAAGIR